MSKANSKISDYTGRQRHPSRHRQLSRRRNLNRLRSLNRQRRLNHLRRLRNLRTLYHNIGSWLPRYKSYTQRNGLFPVPFWVKPYNLPFRSETRPNHSTLEKYKHAWRKYYDYLRNIKRASINTTRIYMSDIVTFHEYLADKYDSHKADLKNSGNGISAETDTSSAFEQYLEESGLAFEKIDHKRLGQYQKWLLDESNVKRARTTVSLKTSALRSSYEYLKSIKTIYYENNPVAKGFRLGERSLPKPLSITETDRLLNIPETDSRFPKRDLAILEVLYSCGIRLSEIHSITLGDINLEQKQIHIRHGKGNNKQRFVLFGNLASTVLNNYLKEERPLLLNKRVVAKSDNVNSPVFLNQYGGQLGQRSIQKIVRKYSDRAGLTNRAHPHTLRHSFATHMLEGEADLRVIQELMGHETPVTTGIYTKLTKIEARKAYFAYHPLSLIHI